MQLIKKIKRLRNLRLFREGAAQTILLLLCLAGDAAAESCVAPLRPFVPNDPRAVQDYADIIQQDFELYIRDIQRYFRCLDEERRRAFEESREVSEEYRRFLDFVGQ